MANGQQTATRSHRWFPRRIPKSAQVVMEQYRCPSAQWRPTPSQWTLRTATTVQAVRAQYQYRSQWTHTRTQQLSFCRVELGNVDDNAVIDSITAHVHCHNAGPGQRPIAIQSVRIPISARDQSDGKSDGESASSSRSPSPSQCQSQRIPISITFWCYKSLSLSFRPTNG